jgi:hypothetical protein
VELLVAFLCRNPEFKTGDIVAIKPDGHRWGRKERLPSFVICEIAETLQRAEVCATCLNDPNDYLSAVVAKRQFRVSKEAVDRAVLTGRTVITIDDIEDKFNRPRGEINRVLRNKSARTDPRAGRRRDPRSELPTRQR